MCGIAGYYGRSELSQGVIQKCLNLMNRRGPDANGVFNHKTKDGFHVTLLHSRLSILDIDPRSNQPFQGKKTTLSYNGEIYNFKEIRSSLEECGHTFNSQGDTEVLSTLLETKGLNGLSECEGMWAFALFNHENGQLVLSRDRFGEKPLYIHRCQNGDVFFASEIKFIISLLGQKLPINIRHLRRYLVNGYKSLYKTRETFFEGLEELRPGHVAIVNGNKPYLETPYWVPSFGKYEDDMSYEEAVEGTRERLFRSVELRLRADVPIAFCLSGGIDSNALIGAACKGLGYDTHGFTIVNNDSRYEELDLVEASVKYLGIKNTRIPNGTSNFLENLRTLIRQHDAPVYTITYYAQWRLMEAIAQNGYKVSVSGTAADEIFSGYYDHHNAYLAAMKSGEADFYPTALGNWEKHIRPIVRNPYLQDPDYFVDRPYSRDHIYLGADSFSDILTEPFAESFSEQFYTEPLLRNRMANELLAESVPVILHEDDLNAMYHSIENRSPFLDLDLFEWCNRIPTKHLFREGRAKAILRDAARGLVPDEVLDNPKKVGFNAPILDYLDLEDTGVKSMLLEDSPVFDIIKREKIANFLSGDNYKNSESKFLFNFVNAKLFLEEFA